MKKDLDDYLVILAYVILTLGLLLCAMENIERPWYAIFISLAIIISFTLKELFYYYIEDNNKVYLLLFFIEILIILLLSFVSKGRSFELFYIVVMYQVVFNFKRGFYISISIVVYLLCLLSNFIKFGNLEYSSFVSSEILDFFAFAMIFTILCLLKYIDSINKNLEATKNSLSIKNLELTNANENIKHAYKKNEEYLIIEERNKMAREIHDTVGHTLTTALVEMEVCSILLNDNVDKASEKINSAISQVRKGLFEVRSSVSALKKEEDIDYSKEILELISNTISHTEVVIHHAIDDFHKEDNEVKKCIYRALQEGLTNGIRHGGANAFVFKLKYSEHGLLFSLEDNGKGCSQIKKGFGIKAMEDRVNEVKGELNIISDSNEGFNIYIIFNKNEVKIYD
ncbi:sensor histidine kinase [Clostridium estertheticum]|uniref:sensor histidine kinase n=1 Tax=Clostridium estertheticum TaxID=238834 RepID=UPI0013E91F1C|nr:sensor histidine kinase [Clostridium estertheticum]MBZ9685599.1 sensor histidine kinase [Clostridium estertheticum]